MEKMQNKIICKQFLTLILLLMLIIDVRSANNELLSKLKIEKDIISAAIESISMINKAKLMAINSTTSESMLLYTELLKTLESPELIKENEYKLNEIMNSCIQAHRVFIADSKIRINDNLDLISELKEFYPDIFKSSFCIDSISKYTEALTAIDKMKTGSLDIYDVIKMIIMSDRTFASDINDFKAIK